MDALIELVKNFDSLKTLFQSTFGITLMTYFLSLGYFNQLFGNLAVGELPNWDGDIEAWLLGILATIASLLFALFPGAPVAAFLGFYMVGIFLLLVVLWFLIIRLMYHDLPRWLANALLAFMILFTVLATAILTFLALAEPIPGDEIVVFFAVLFYSAFMAAVIALIITLLYKLARAVYRWAKDSWPGTLWRKYVAGEPQSETGGGSSTSGDSGVQNPDGALPHPDGPGHGDAAVIPPDTCITITFDTPIADHLGVPDVRIVRRPTDVPITVDVSNDGQTWESCEKDKDSPSEDYDVPYWNSPWKKVRICNTGNRDILLSDVLDLSN